MKEYEKSKKEFDKNSSEHKMFCDYWTIYQYYWHPQDTEAWWENFYMALRKFQAKYPGQYAKDLVSAINLEVCRRYKEQKKEK